MNACAQLFCYNIIRVFQTLQLNTIVSARLYYIQSTRYTLHKLHERPCSVEYSYVYKVEENDKKPVRRPSRHISSLAVPTGEEEEGTDARLCGEDMSFLSLSPLATGTASGVAEAMGLDAGAGCVGVGDTGEVVQDEEADVVGCEGIVFAGGGEAGLVRMKYGARVERLRPNILGGRAPCLSAAGTADAAAGVWAGIGLCAFRGELAS